MVLRTLPASCQPQGPTDRRSGSGSSGAGNTGSGGSSRRPSAGWRARTSLRRAAFLATTLSCPALVPPCTGNAKGLLSLIGCFLPFGGKRKGPLAANGKKTE